MALSGITSNNLPPAIQRQIQNAVKNGGNNDIGKLLVLQGVSIVNNTTNNNSSPWVDLLNLLPPIILRAMLGVNNTSAQNNIASTESTTQTNTKDIQSIKQGLNNDLNELKALGVKVSDWDNNNSCTLSYQGKTGTVTITDSG